VLGSVVTPLVLVAVGPGLGDATAAAWTMTSNMQVTSSLPEASIAEQVTVVVPMGNADPDA